MGLLNQIKKSLFSLFDISKPRKKKSKPKKRSSAKKIKKINKPKKSSVPNKLKTKPAKIKIASKLKPVKKAANQKIVLKSKPSAPKETHTEVGVVTHYFPKVKAAALRILPRAEIRIGDNLLFKGTHASFKQKVTSLQINRIPIEVGKSGEEVGLMVKKSVSVGDNVYKM